MSKLERFGLEVCNLAAIGIHTDTPRHYYGSGNSTVCHNLEDLPKSVMKHVEQGVLTDRKIKARRDKRSDLKEKVVGLRSHIEELEGAGLDEAIQRKAREVELADDQLQRYGREVSVLSLLLSTLRSAETEAKVRHLSPVLKRVRPYLQLLLPGAETPIDENLHIVGVARENGY